MCEAPLCFISPGVSSQWCLLSGWCHVAISFSVALFFCPQFFLVSEFFPMVSLLASAGQSFRTSFFRSFSVNPSNEYSEFISFMIEWFYLLAVQGTLKSLLQHHSSKASVLWWLAFLWTLLSHPYMMTGKTIALTIRTFVVEVISLFFNTLSRFVKAFFPRSKHILISWLQSLSLVILEPNGGKRDSICVSIFSPSFYFPWKDGTGCYGFSFLNAEF